MPWIVKRYVSHVKTLTHSKQEKLTEVTSRFYMLLLPMQYSPSFDARKAHNENRDVTLTSAKQY